MKDDDSDNDEGFVPTKMEIKPKIQPQQPRTKQMNLRPTDYQSRYIFGDGILRKEPSQVYTRFDHYLPTVQSSSKEGSFRVREDLEHPYQKYIASGNYCLVYSRNKDKSPFLPGSDYFTNNEVDLVKVLNKYSEDDYSVLKPFQCQTQNETEGKENIVFDSRFQGGNLQYAFKNNRYQNHYSLFLQNDTNSYGYNQWFYFSLKNTKPGCKYHFTIVNLKKKSSFFSKGMKVSVFSLKDAENNDGLGWRKMGQNIKYEKSCIRKDGDKKYKFYSLSFDISFLHDNDYVCLAMNTPYSYSRMIHNVKICKTLSQKHEDREWKMEIVAYSICNNAVPCLTLCKKQIEPKKMIIFMARQHPGETWSSFLMEEILYYLSQSKNEAVDWLLENYVVKIFPMINVDGVIYGNFRCDIGGFDLNRNWKNPTKNLHPQVFSIKQEIQRLSTEYRIECVMDLHGHSKQYNTFCYSCKDDPIKCRVLPKIISSATDIFSFKDCTFGISKYKQTTARAVIYSIIENENVLTIENSFYGFKDKQTQTQIYDPSIMKTLGETIINGLSAFLDKGETYVKYLDDVKMNLKEYLSYQTKGVIDSGSESDPYGDQISFKQKIKKILPKSFVHLQKQLASQSPKKKVKKKIVKINIDSGKKFQTIMQSKFGSSSRKKYEQKQIQHQTYIQRTSLTQYKKNSKQLSFITKNKNDETINSAFSEDAARKRQTDDLSTNGNKSLISNKNDIQLPFYCRDKPKLVPIKLKNDSLEIFKDAYNATKEKQEKEKTSVGAFRKTNFNQTLRRGRNNQGNNEEFPILCVFSENKKKKEIEKKKKEEQKMEQKPKIIRPYVQNERLEYIKKTTREKSLVDKTQGNAALLSKIWRDNFTRYGRDLGVFFGEIKKT